MYRSVPGQSRKKANRSWAAAKHVSNDTPSASPPLKKNYRNFQQGSPIDPHLLDVVAFHVHELPEPALEFVSSLCEVFQFSA